MIRPLAFVLILFVGCAGLPEMELCYDHPIYGAVCVKVGGKKLYRADLTPEQKAEVDKWISEKEKGAP